ncbi:hypothetical protein GLOIN_2v1639014 [Rhizophagus irregularis DAOM 181602=DAOM 197198]|nr:hypothetical protein GLOIN_2v1639014 [Rhizophagus irregularis DAOM 181602=DAOM 197198]CAB4491443.1 unnamed protein product [Rhizophagus irregularis]CAB5216378.1 unnamed protein product [Rhizophagus irregularis]
MAIYILNLLNKMSIEDINSLKVPSSLLTHSKNRSVSSLSTKDSHEINIEDEIPLLLTSPKPIHNNKPSSEEIYYNKFSNDSIIYHLHINHTNSSTKKDKIKKKRLCRKIKEFWNWLIDPRHPKRKSPLIILIILAIVLSIFAIKGFRDSTIYILATMVIIFPALLYLCKS